MNTLEYHEDRESNIAPHFDDFWVWGEYIAGLNLLEPTVITYSKKLSDKIIEIDLHVPPRALYIISGKARFEWMHGIKQENIKKRRLVFTYRELTTEFREEYPELAEKLEEVAKDSV